MGGDGVCVVTFGGEGIVASDRTEVRRFVDTYNCEWRVGKIGFKSPWQATAEWLAQDSLARAA
jgi:hypothetical protein